MHEEVGLVDVAPQIIRPLERKGERNVFGEVVPCRGL